MPREVCTMAKGVRCGKPFSMNEMLERGGEKAKARRRSSLLGRSTGWLMQPIVGGAYIIPCIVCRGDPFDRSGGIVCEFCVEWRMTWS